MPTDLDPIMPRHAVERLLGGVPPEVAACIGNRPLAPLRTDQVEAVRALRVRVAALAWVSLGELAGQRRDLAVAAAAGARTGRPSWRAG